MINNDHSSLEYKYINKRFSSEERNQQSELSLPVELMFRVLGFLNQIRQLWHVAQASTQFYRCVFNSKNPLSREFIWKMEVELCLPLKILIQQPEKVPTIDEKIFPITIKEKKLKPSQQLRDQSTNLKNAIIKGITASDLMFFAIRYDKFINGEKKDEGFILITKRDKFSWKIQYFDPDLEIVIVTPSCNEHAFSPVGFYRADEIYKRLKELIKDKICKPVYVNTIGEVTESPGTFRLWKPK